MELHVIVEEPSAEAALRSLIPRILDKRDGFKIINMGSKGRMLAELPKRFEGYAALIRQGKPVKVVVLVDADQGDWAEAKETLESLAARAGLVTRARARKRKGSVFHVVTRVAVAELEAWFLGDVQAVRRAYPQLPAAIAKKREFATPDGWQDTWERLHGLLRRNGYPKSSFSKIDMARRIAMAMDPAVNTSPSFKSFCCGLLAC